jgi:putative endonuclease
MGAASVTRQLGTMGESLCAFYLRRLGYTVLCRNWYCRWGEIDIIAQKSGQLIFVEVKTVSSTKFCTAKELFHPAKRRKLLRSIAYYNLSKKCAVNDWRLDLICLTKDDKKVWLEHYKNVLAL